MHKDERITMGEMIDEKPLDFFLNHPQFHQLKIFKALNEWADTYWEITMESIVDKENEKYMSIFNTPVMDKYHRFFKVKHK